MASEGMEETKAQPIVPSVDDGDVDAVEEQAPGPRAVQIVDVSVDGDKFVLNEEELVNIIQAVPEDMKVSVLAVVGAYRTGKSFILDIILRYLQYCEDHPEYTGEIHDDISKDRDSAWMHSGTTLGGSPDDPEGAASGFKWRPGRERQTTGIWMWSKHFVRTLNDTGEKVAVLVMDTQGMFDSKTSQQLTTSIFGMSTLISSYLVYNVSLQIQEDNLQHLALFSEYGRVALQSLESAVTGEQPTKQQPFQHVEFLVRDATPHGTSMTAMIAEMDRHLQQLLAQNSHDDLRHTREQIHECFESVASFELPHPGFAVSGEESFDGAVDAIRAKFRRMVHVYVERLFQSRLAVKRVHGREVTARELLNYISEYAKLFTEATIFPKAESLLNATATANNRSALDSSLSAYNREMDRKAGPSSGYVVPKDLKAHHETCMRAAVEKYDGMANFGPSHIRQEYSTKLRLEIDSSWARYREHNKRRDPWRNLEMYILAGAIGAAAYILRFLSDNTCGHFSQVCSSASDFFSLIYMSLFSLMLISALFTYRVFYKRIHNLVSVLTGGGGSAAATASHAHSD